MSTDLHTENCDPEFGCDETCTAPLPPDECVGGVSADFGRGYDLGIATAYRSQQQRINAALVQYLIGMPARVKHCRATNGLSLREVSKQTGISASTLMRIEHGEDYTVGSLMALAVWLDKWTPRESSVAVSAGAR